MDLVLDDDDTSIVAAVHHKSVATVQNDAFAVAAIETHQCVATLDPFGPSRDVIAELEDRVASDRVEVMLTVNEAGKPSPHNFEERVERGKCGVRGVHLDSRAVRWSSFSTCLRVAAGHYSLLFASCSSAARPSFLIRLMRDSRSAAVRPLVAPSIARLWTPKTLRISVVPFGVSETNRVRRSSASAARTTRA